ncbi:MULTISPECIES: hypothetical protein [Bradyrhizobium]|uniref:hypothetical protein n=1 Tax=Bradyrhizobium TaxID=374 RepID=UPI000488DA79|nr:MULTISPECIES: hypothetical protein [Bradyrhizobium]MCS3447259.1 hypothetical protein [Bradyrhizobium elkanii]MCS3561604.1 hypothetical protein [Bradyrhizobium elkanii]MCW2148555.1 hypothetical protein [Bradyrhizobium elkanii]MCW2352358.1 hypothetical protein [Bradyrhizobium elkanii]MCW2372283.1 hypothetical protein [Bradyrhizobium elkanii]
MPPFDLIVSAEVTSEAWYSKHLRWPTWVGEQSGVTIDCGCGEARMSWVVAIVMRLAGLAGVNLSPFAAGALFAGSLAVVAGGAAIAGGMHLYNAGFIARPMPSARRPMSPSRMHNCRRDSRKGTASSFSPKPCSSATPSVLRQPRSSSGPTRGQSMQRRLILTSALLATCLAGCVASGSVDKLQPPPPDAPNIPPMPADVAACERAPVDTPDRDLDAGEIERLWKTDRAALAKVNACLRRAVCQ